MTHFTFLQTDETRDGQRRLTDIAPQGPDRLFTSRQLDQLVVILDEVALRAAA